MAHAPSPVGCPSIFLAPRARGVSAVTRDLRTGLDELFAYFGMFLSSVTKTGPDGKSRLSSRSAPGSDIQSIFFDMSRQDHLDAALNEVPGDLVTASTSSLDLDITLTNAEFQLDRVAASGRTTRSATPRTWRYRSHPAHAQLSRDLGAETQRSFNKIDHMCRCMDCEWVLRKAGPRKYIPCHLASHFELMIGRRGEQ
jgi:K+-transporting ATPase, c chain